MPRAALLLSLSLAALTACVPTSPCDEYVDYICDCHADDNRPGYDCDTLRVTYQNADPELQDECQVALNEQEQQDVDEGYLCDAGDSAVAAF